MKLFNIQKLAIFTSSLVIVATLFLLGIQLTIPLNYPDFITGHVTWNATTKFQDLIVMPLMVLGGFIFFLLLTEFFEKINKSTTEENSKNIAYHMVLWGLPAFSTISSLIIHKGFDEGFLAISLLGILSIFSTSWYLTTKNIKFDIEAISIGLIIVLFISLIPLSVIKLVNTFLIHITGSEISQGTLKLWIASFLAISLILYLFLVFVRYEFFVKKLSKIILLGQLALPFLFLSLYPARLMEASGQFSDYDTTIYLKILVLLLVLAASADIFYRYFKYGSTSGYSLNLFSPLVIVALLIAMKLGNTRVPIISPDDYHFGEDLLGWWTYLKGYLPYIDYMPAHGLIGNDFAGLLNVIFYDGTAASRGESQRLAFSLLTIIAFMSVYISTRSLLLAFVAIYFFLGLGGRISWLFLIPFVALWFNRKLIENKVKWSIIWFASTPLAILGIPPQGLLLVAASGVIPLYYLWETLKSKNWAIIKPVMIGFVIILTIYAITPLGSMLLHAVSYVLVNGSINQVAYGIPWSPGFNGKGVIFETARMSWVVVPAVSLTALYFLYKKDKFKSFFVLPLIATFLFSFLLIPYSMGRIVPDSLSRPGMVGILLITGFMSLLIWQILDRFSRIWLLIGIVLLASIVNFTFTAASLSPLLSSATTSINVGHLRATDGTALQNIGRARVQQEHWERLNRLASLFNENLNPQESYLDLTSRSAQYFYLDRKPIIPDTAPYNMASPSQQLNAIKLLKLDLPRLALLEGNNIIHDGGGVALRNHYLYRFIIEHYEPFEINGFVIGLSKESIARGDWRDISIPNSIDKIALFEKAFSRPRVDLRKLPISWGRSEKKLNKKMEFIFNFDDIKPRLHDLEVRDKNLYVVTGRDPFSIYEISSLALAGKDAGLLKFDFKCYPERQEPKIQIFWWGDEQTGPSGESSLFFTATNETLIVPLDASPRWLLLDKVKGLRIDLHNADACGAYSIENLSLYSRKSLID